MLFIGCSSTNKPVNITPDVKIDTPRNERGVEESSDSETYEANLRYPYFVKLRFRYFVQEPMEAFYALNKRFPSTFDEYKNSGFLMIIPTDYVSGKPYHLVDNINLEDTSGFTFSSDGQDSCKFEFVIHNRQTDAIEKIDCDLSGMYNDYKTGFTSKMIQSFDSLKYNYCIGFFGAYYQLALNKYRHQGIYPEQYPHNLKDIFTGEGILIKKGWEWVPETDSKYNFEFGIDPEKFRFYIATGCGRSEGKPCHIFIGEYDGTPVVAKHMDNSGREQWEYDSFDDIPADFFVRKTMVTSKSFIDAYYDITG